MGNRIAGGVDVQQRERALNVHLGTNKPVFLFLFDMLHVSKDSAFESMCTCTKAHALINVATNCKYCLTRQ